MKTILKKQPTKAAVCNTSIMECEPPQNVDGILMALDEAIKKRNTNFSSMSKLEKRTEIAKDVIASLNSKKYKAERGTYLELFNKNKRSKNEYGHLTNGYDENLKLTSTNLKEESTVCHVCAIGSVFTSFAQKTKSSLSADANSMLRSMNSIFSKTEMRILEMLFEGSFIHDEQFKKLDVEKQKIIKKYGSEFKKNSKGSADKRLRAIMDNIIDNNGKFIFGEMLLDGTF
jgi:hypothetical protein